jgi:carbon-monoxide dehydrogenase medium subunit
MLLPEFELLEPESIEEALIILAERGPDARIIAGGTDVLPDLKREYDRRLRFPALPSFRPGPFPRALVSLLKVADLGQIRELEDGSISVGALAVISAIAENPGFHSRLNALVEGAASVGTPQVRNRATLGGNLCNARPCADTAPAALVLGGTMIARSAGGNRRIPAAGFFKGPGSTALKPGEILESVVFPRPLAGSGSAYRKLGVRNAAEISVVSAAAFVALEGGLIRAASVALGSAGPVPLLCPSAAAALIGAKIDAIAVGNAAKLAVRDASIIADFRASAEYRSEMAAVMCERAIEAAVRRAAGTAAGG